MNTIVPRCLLVISLLALPSMGKANPLRFIGLQTPSSINRHYGFVRDISIRGQVGGGTEKAPSRLTG